MGEFFIGRALYTKGMQLLSTLIHRWLKIPYTLHVELNRPGVSKRAATVLFIHGIGNSGAAWEEVVGQLPPEPQVITIDLLGFGKSPRPAWATYDAKTQARSVIATLIKLRIRGPVVIVGHSLGALVAVEVTKRYPVIVRSLILCSPPFYKLDAETKRLFPSSDRLLMRTYKLVKDHPEQLMRLSVLALKLGLVNKAFNLTRDDLASYLGALESSIINQTSLEDAKRLKKPVRIIIGRLDPVVVTRNIKELAAANKHVSYTIIMAGHEVQGRFVPAVTTAIAGETKKPANKRRKASRKR